MTRHGEGRRDEAIQDDVEMCGPWMALSRPIPLVAIGSIPELKLWLLRQIVMVR